MELSPLSLQFTSEDGEVIFRRFPLKFITRQKCPLCDQAEPVVRQAARWAGASIELVDVDSDDDLIRLYSLRIPVVLGPQGDVVAEGRIDAAALRRAIRASRRRQRPGTRAP